MNPKEPFKWRHFKSEIILLNVRWYLRYPLSYRDLEEIMLERGPLLGVTVDQYPDDYALAAWNCYVAVGEEVLRG